MPTRILRDWTDSEKVHAIGEQGESLFTRLLMKADDYGCYIANPKLLKSTCYPLRDDLRDADMTRRLAACEKAGLLSVYEVDHTGASRWLPAGELAGAAANGNKRYLVIHGFGQRLKHSRRKCPPPPESPPPGSSPQPAPTSGNFPELPGSGGKFRPDSESDTDVEAEAESLSPAAAGGGGAFDRFWSAWPSGGRKADRKGCAKIWARERLDAKAAEVLAGLDRWRRSAEWAKSAGQFIPAPSVWLNQARWEAHPPADGEPAGGGPPHRYPNDIGPGYELSDDLAAVLAEIPRD